MSELYGAPLPIILREIVRPALQMAGIWSEAREQLVLGTGAVESGYRWLVQRGGGPALGYWQCEKATHFDLWQNWIPSKPELKDRLRIMCEGIERDGALIAFPMYAAAICGAHYLRDRRALPAAGDAQGMAAMHKAAYNSALGKTDPAESVIHFQRAIEACR